jgi:hypothetical protein
MTAFSAGYNSAGNPAYTPWSPLTTSTEAIADYENNVANYTLSQPPDDIGYLSMSSGMNVPPQTYWGIFGAALGQYAGKQIGPIVRQMGIDNLRRWGEEQGMSSFEIEELMAAAEGAEEGGAATAEFGPWAFGGMLLGAAAGVGTYYLWDLSNNPPPPPPAPPAPPSN